MKMEAGLVSKTHSGINPGVWLALNWWTGVKTLPLTSNWVWDDFLTAT